MSLNMNERNQGRIDCIFHSNCFAISIDKRRRVYRTHETLVWYVIDGECRASGDHFMSVMQAVSYDHCISRFLHIRKTAYCINVDILTLHTASNYGVPYLLEEKNYVNFNQYTPAEY